jgi:2-polyprenyl-3-methyl-5-hydroxy-6-metoxy-1,4-benzoquinol methylase
MPTHVPPEEKKKSLSLLRSVHRFFSALFGVGHTRAETEDHRWQIKAVGERVDGLGRDLARDVRETRDLARNLVRDLLRDFEGRLTAMQRQNDEQQNEIIRLRLDNALFSRAYSDLTRRVDVAFYRLLPAALAGQENDILRGASPALRVPSLDGLEALLASFYNRLQERNRGSREEIKRRAQKYVADVQAIVKFTGKPILDLGAGRGEWLELLAEEKLEAVGVDFNAMQVKEAADSNITIHHGDACAYLLKCATSSFGVISAFHLVEHLPFDTLTWLVREALRVLAPGGLLLLETPNSRNVLVGATSFYTDPTHVKPLPPEVLQTLLESLGYHPIEVRFVHPHERLELFLREKRLDQEIAQLFFGPQDTAILAHKPSLSRS